MKLVKLLTEEWGLEGDTKRMYEEIWQKFIPSEGESERPEAELVRCLSRFSYDWFNNGGWNSFEESGDDCSECGGDGTVEDYCCEDPDCEDCGGQGDYDCECGECGGSGSENSYAESTFESTYIGQCMQKVVASGLVDSDDVERLKSLIVDDLNSIGVGHPNSEAIEALFRKLFDRIVPWAYERLF